MAWYSSAVVYEEEEEEATSLITFVIIESMYHCDAGHFSRTVPQRSYSIADSIDGYPVHQATSAGAA